MDPSPRRILGVHAGSTSCSAAIVHPKTREPEILPPLEGRGGVLPSVLHVDGGGTILVGEPALRAAAAAPDGLLPFDPAGLGSEAGRVAGGVAFTSEDVCVHLLRDLKANSERTLEEDLSEVVLVVPSFLDEAQRASLRRAALRAGFARVYRTDPCSAAVLAYPTRGAAPRTVLVLRLGGHHLEASVCLVTEERVEVLSHAHDRLGGADWDEALHRLVMARAGQDADPIGLGDGIRRLKAHLSTARKATLTAGGLRLEVTRADFEEAAAPLLERCRDLIQRATRSHGWEGIQHVLLVGGAARIPSVQGLVENLSGRTAARGPALEEVLALGAARAGALGRYLEPDPLPPPPETETQPAAPVTSAPPGPEERPTTRLPAEAPEPTVQAARAPRLTLGQKSAVLQGISRGCWRAVPLEGGRQAWALPADFTRHYFPDQPYQEIFLDTEPGDGNWSWILFTCTDGGMEICLRSRQAPGEFYEFAWETGRLPAEVNRLREGRAVGCARLVPVAAPPGFLLDAPDLDERVQFCPGMLLRLDAESRRDRIIRILPWVRILIWFGRLRQVDPPAFGRVPGAIRAVLNQPDFESAITHLQPEAIGAWIQQGLLPHELEPVSREQADGLLRTLVTLQQMGGQAPPPQQGFWSNLGAGIGMASSAPKVPRLLLQVLPQKLDLLDLQVFVTIGALKSVETLFDRECRKLVARRPDLQALLKSPEGQSRVLNDPEVQQLRVHPEVLKEQQEQAWRSMGMAGPTPMEQGKAMERTLAMQMLFGVAFDPGSRWFDKRVPWKIYEPVG